MPTPAHIGTTERIALADADVCYTPQFLDATTADALLTRLLTDIEWQQQQVRLFGRSQLQPRMTAWFGDPGTRYRYSGVEHIARGWTPELYALRARVEQHVGSRFNSVLLNLYRDGADSMGAHSDDEPELGPSPVIAALSLGAERPLVMRHRSRNDLVQHAVPHVVPHAVQHAVLLAHGSLFVMRGSTQQHWRHGVPKSRRPCDPRVSLTFRFACSRPKG